MKSLTEVNIVFVLFWSAAAFVIFRYRVYIHVHYESRGESRKGQRSCGVQKNGKQGRVIDAPVPKDERVNTLEDLTSALVNLGCKQGKAKQIATRVSQRNRNADFDQLLRVAMREAA